MAVAGATGRSSGLPLSILLVEDNKVNQLVTSQLLSRWGFSVKIACHGEEALEMISDKRYSAVLMDIQMPKMDGCEATQNIRQMRDQYFKTVPILAFTASTIADTKEKAMQLGMTDYVGKPLNPDELKEKLDLYINRETEKYRYNINFDLYTDGDDEFKVKLVRLMIGNMQELKEASTTSYNQKTDFAFKKAMHKVNASLIIINDTELEDVIEELKDSFTSCNDLVLKKKVEGFRAMCENVIQYLQSELPASSR